MKEFSHLNYNSCLLSVHFAPLFSGFRLFNCTHWPRLSSRSGAEVSVLPHPAAAAAAAAPTAPWTAAGDQLPSPGRAVGSLSDNRFS